MTKALYWRCWLSRDNHYVLNHASKWVVNYGVAKSIELTLVISQARRILILRLQVRRLHLMSPSAQIALCRHNIHLPRRCLTLLLTPPFEVCPLYTTTLKYKHAHGVCHACYCTKCHSRLVKDPKGGPAFCPTCLDYSVHHFDWILQQEICCPDYGTLKLPAGGCPVCFTVEPEELCPHCAFDYNAQGLCPHCAYPRPDGSVQAAESASFPSAEPAGNSLSHRTPAASAQSSDHFYTYSPPRLSA